MVQVVIQRRGDQQTIEAEMSRSDPYAHDQRFVVVQSKAELLSAFGQDHLEIWTGGRLADLAINAGAYPWLMGRVR